MRLSLASIVALGLIGSSLLFDSAVAAPSSEISVETLNNRGISVPKGGKGKPKGGKGDPDDPDVPPGGPGGSQDVPPVTSGDLASGASRSTREKGTLEQNMPNAHVETRDDYPLANDQNRGNAEYLAGIVDANKKWTFNEIYDMSKGDGEEFFKYAVSTEEKGIVVRNARTQLDDPTADAARTFKARDILMDGWIKETTRTGTPVSSLKYVIQDDVVTVDSQQVIDRAFATSGRDRGAKAEFSLNVPADKAAFDLLTTGNIHGNGITKMVQLNHVDLGDLQIVKVSAWTNSAKMPGYYALAFELGHV